MRDHCWTAGHLVGDYSIHSHALTMRRKWSKTCCMHLSSHAMFSLRASTH